MKTMNTQFYTKIPDYLLNLPIPPAAFRVLLTLASFAKQRGECTCALPTLCARCHLSLNTVRKALRELEEMGLIQPFPRYQEQGGRLRRTSNGYRLGWTFVERDNPSLQVGPKEQDPCLRRT